MHVVLLSAVRFEETSQRAIPTIGLYYLQAYIQKYSPGNQITVVRTPEEVVDLSPDAVGISTVTENMNVATTWAEGFREKLGVPILLGGDHISALPHTLPEIFDVGINGEGEEAFLRLLNLMNSEPNWRKKLDRVPGICYRDCDGRVNVNPRPALIEPLDRIPHPAREKAVWGGFHYVFSSRGCPYNCTFCSPKVIWKRYRAFSGEYVIEELDEIFNNFKPFYVHFFDDLFIGDRKRVSLIRKLVRERGYHERAVFGGHIRADMMDDELCLDLKRMNFLSGAFGAESGSEKILKFLKTGSTTVDLNQRAIDLCNKHGIDLNLSFIIGTPGETREDLEKTISFIDRNRTKMQGIEVFIILPYPGTPIWTMAKRRGLVTDDMNWDLFRTKAFFQEMEITDDFLYLNDTMEREEFRHYVDVFKGIDRELNKNNTGIFDFIEKGVPEPVKIKNNS